MHKAALQNLGVRGLVPECLAGIVVSRLPVTKIASFHFGKIFSGKLNMLAIIF